MRKAIITAILFSMGTVPGLCTNNLLHNYSSYARVAYNLGGTAPIGMP